MSRLLGDLAYGNLVQVAEAVETGRLAPPFSGFSVSRHVPGELCDQVARELNRLYESGMQVQHLAYLLHALANERLAIQNADRSVQLVWSGPEVPARSFSRGPPSDSPCRPHYTADRRCCGPVSNG